MQSVKAIHGISAHAEGEVGDVIGGGVTPPPSGTGQEKPALRAAGAGQEGCDHRSMAERRPDRGCDRPRGSVGLDDIVRYDLPPLPYGQRYAVVDDRIVEIEAESGKILQLIRIFTALGN